MPGSCGRPSDSAVTGSRAAPLKITRLTAGTGTDRSANVEAPGCRGPEPDLGARAHSVRIGSQVEEHRVGLDVDKRGPCRGFRLRAPGRHASSLECPVTGAGV